MKRVRFGVKVKFPFGLFPNAGIFVLRLSDLKRDELFALIEQVRFLLLSQGYEDIANRLVCEES